MAPVQSPPDDGLGSTVPSSEERAEQGDLPFTYSEQMGDPGKCFTAQVWDANGDSVAQIEATQDPAVANSRAALFAAAPDFAVACGADLHPAENATCGPLSWLTEAIKVINDPKARALFEGDDPDAYTEMCVMVERLHVELSAALEKATGQKARAALGAST